MPVDRDDLAAVIDHTNLNADATRDDIAALCREAVEYDCGAVCVYSEDVEIAAAYRDEHDADYDICSVVNFPHGKTPSAVAALEAGYAVDAGSDEVDLVINQRHILDEAYDAAKQDVDAVRRAVPDATLKVILETCNLSPDEIRAASHAAIASGADFLKTSTGFGADGAREEDIAVMADVIGEYDSDVGIKASGGIGTAAEALQMRDASGRALDRDVFRIGASSGPAIIDTLAEMK